jgi:hypothetical protein
MGGRKLHRCKDEAYSPVTLWAPLVLARVGGGEKPKDVTADPQRGAKSRNVLVFRQHSKDRKLFVAHPNYAHGTNSGIQICHFLFQIKQQPDRV